MKKKFAKTLFSLAMVAALTAGGVTVMAADKGNGESVQTANLKLTNVNYTTVTEGFDWGPAITKVVLNMGTTMNGSTLSKDTFTVSSVREYTGFDYTAMTPAETKETVKRTITAAYVSDALGNKAAGGSYITLQMEVGPDLTAGSPFNYDLSTGQNKYVDTSYIIALSKGAELKTADGRRISMNETGKRGYKGNSNLIADEFDKSGTYTKDGVTLRYASYIPDSASVKKESNPLIIWLHGAGEGGADPAIALLGNKVVNLATEQIQSYFGDTGAYVLVPQCKTMWMDYDGTGTYNNYVEGSAGSSYYTEALKGLIDAFVESHPAIDKNRIYIGGCSNGGFMTMNMITNYPDYFAAAFPICEAYSNNWLTDEKIQSIKNLPIWFTHAKTDGMVPIYKGTMDYTTFQYTLTLDTEGKPIAIDDYSNAAYNRLVAAGAGNVHYSLFDSVLDLSGTYKTAGTNNIYEYNGHWSWIYALNNQCKEKIDGKEISLFEWLADQSR